MLGGAPTVFHVVEESNRHFRFSVASIKVGFMVLALKRVIAESFTHVVGGGRPATGATWGERGTWGRARARLLWLPPPTAGGGGEGALPGGTNGKGVPSPGEER